jgi:hypothetical protein
MKSESNNEYEDENDDLIDNYNYDEDWNKNSPKTSLKSENEIKSTVIKPQTQTSVESGRGYDSESKQMKMGYKPSGFDEGNTHDLTTANFNNPLDEEINKLGIAIMSTLLNENKITGLDTTPSYRLILHLRDQYNSMTKSRMGKGMELAMINKTENTIRKSNISYNNKNQNSKLDELNDNFDFDEADL